MQRDYQAEIDKLTAHNTILEQYAQQMRRHVKELKIHIFKLEAQNRTAYEVNLDYAKKCRELEKALNEYNQKTKNIQIQNVKDSVPPNKKNSTFQIKNSLQFFAAKKPALKQDLSPKEYPWYFWMSGLESIEQAQAMHKIMYECMKNGLHYGTFQGKAHQLLEQWGMRKKDFSSPEEQRAYHRSPAPLDSLERLRLTYQTQTKQAHAITRWQEGFNKEELEDFPCWRFVRIDGARTPRPDHVRQEETVRFKWDWKYWANQINSPSLRGFNVPWPPFGYNSYMDIVPASIDEAPDEYTANFIPQNKSQREETILAALAQIDEQYGTNLINQYHS